MKKVSLIIVSTLVLFSVLAADDDTLSLRDEFNGLFLIGAALNRTQIQGEDQATPEFIASQFNALTAENEMKWERIHPQEDRYVWTYTDALVDFASNNDMHLTGHTLVWHSQAPDWVFEDANGNAASRELLLARMESHISTVVGRYKGRVHSWDVVNEALNEDGSLRDSRWRQIIGDDYMQKAFEFAHKADPDARLYYNDYNLFQPEKRNGAINIVRELQQAGVRIDGVGMQAHYSLAIPADLGDVEGSIIAFAAEGVDVLITELDVSVLPFPADEDPDVGGRAYVERYDPYRDGLTAAAEQQFNQRYVDLFSIFLKHSEKISRVTFWGVSDADSWKNNFPMFGRTDYPLLFDRNSRSKAAINKIIELKN